MSGKEISKGRCWDGLINSAGGGVDFWSKMLLVYWWYRWWSLMNHKSSLKMARRIFSWKDAQLAKQVGECVGLTVLRTWEQGNQNKIIMQEGYLRKLSSSLGPISSIQFPNFWPYLVFMNIYIISMKGKLRRRHQCTPLGLCVNAQGGQHCRNVTEALTGQTPLQALSIPIWLWEMNRFIYGETEAPRSYDLPRVTQIMTNGAESIR